MSCKRFIAFVILTFVAIEAHGKPNEFISQSTKINRTDAAADERFGASVALSGSTVVIGSPQDQTNGVKRGAAYIFDRQSMGEWQQIDKFTPSNPAQIEGFGYSVAISGNTVVVGSQREYASVFRRASATDSDWQLSKDLMPEGASGNQWFGLAVGVSGNTAIVGAPNARSAYIFDRNNGGSDNWGQAAALHPVGGTNPNRFGYTVAISGDNALVGAMYEEANGPESGAAYVFERNLGGQNSWGQAVRLQPSDVVEYDRFGQGVAIDGDTAVVGAWWDDGNGTQTGSAYVFERDAGGAGSWGQVAKLTALDITDHLGFSVSISGDLIILGAPWDDDKGNQAGAAYFFERNRGGTNHWGQIAKVTASDGYSSAFGESVAISGNLAIVGVTYDSEFGQQAGAAYAYVIPEPASLTLAFISMFFAIVSRNRGRIARKERNGCDLSPARP